MSVQLDAFQKGTKLCLLLHGKIFCISNMQFEKSLEALLIDSKSGRKIERDSLCQQANAQPNRRPPKPLC